MCTFDFTYKELITRGNLPQKLGRKLIPEKYISPTRPAPILSIQ